MWVHCVLDGLTCLARLGKHVPVVTDLRERRDNYPPSSGRRHPCPTDDVRPSKRDSRHSQDRFKVPPGNHAEGSHKPGYKAQPSLSLRMTIWKGCPHSAFSSATVSFGLPQARSSRALAADTRAFRYGCFAYDLCQRFDGREGVRPRKLDNLFQSLGSP